MKILIAAIVAITIMLLLVSYSFYTGKAKLPTPSQETVKTQSQLIQEANDIGVRADASAKKCYDIFEEVLIATNSYDNDMKKQVAQSRESLAQGEKLSREVARDIEEVNRMAAIHFNEGAK